MKPALISLFPLLTFITSVPIYKQDNPKLLAPTYTFLCIEEHEVASGDTGDSIASSKNMDVAVLKSYNPSVDWENLPIGSKVCVCGEITPPYPVETPTPTPSIPILIVPTPAPNYTPVPTYTVKCTRHYTCVSEDTGDIISKKCGLELLDLKTINPDVEWTDLQIGQKLCICTADVCGHFPTPSTPVLVIPTATYVPPAPSSSCSTKYTVVQGDTGDIIATKLGITFLELNALNTGVVWNLLQVGQELCVPNITPTPSIPKLIIPTASTTNTPSSLVLIIPTITSISYPPTIINIPPTPLSSVLIIPTITSSTSIPTAPILIIPTTQALPVTHIYTLPECTETPRDSILTPISFSGPCSTQPVCPESTVIQNNCVSPETVIVTQSDQAILVTVTLTSTIEAAAVTNCPL